MLSFLLSISEESNHSKIEYIYYTFHDDMIRFAMFRLRKFGLPNCEMDAEDAVQNAFVKITKYINAINTDVSKNELKSYVLSIVSHEVSNIVSDYVCFDDIDEHADNIRDEDFFASMRIIERYEKVVKAIEKLDEKYSLTLLYRYNENMSVGEIATLMGVPEKTVYTRLERGKKLLLQSINGEGYDV